MQLRLPATACLAGGALLAALLLPTLRHGLESSMSLQMLAQYPALLLAGMLLSEVAPRSLCKRLSAWNRLGIAGLAAIALILGVLMIPRVLDLALLDVRIETAKMAALLFAGAVLRSSWQAAGLVIQGFFLGNVLPMTVIVGTLYQDSPLRLCNAYGLDDQRLLGQSLVWLAVGVAIVWLLHVAVRLGLTDSTTTSRE